MGPEYPLVGYFDHSATMQNPKLTIGYRHLEILGEKLRGHSFITPFNRTNWQDINQKNAIGLPVQHFLSFSIEKRHRHLYPYNVYRKSNP